MVICMRHGETDWNAKGYGGEAEVLRGNIDIPLNAAGMADVGAHAEDIATKFPVTEVRCSPNYQRDKMTGQIVADMCGVPLNFASELDPYNAGELSGKAVAAISMLIDLLIEIPMIPAPGGESMQSFLDEWSAYFHKVYFDEGFGGDDSRAIVLIVHGMEMRALPYVVEGKPMIAYRHQSYKPGEYVVIN